MQKTHNLSAQVDEFIKLYNENKKNLDFGRLQNDRLKTETPKPPPVQKIDLNSMGFTGQADNNRQQDNYNALDAQRSIQDLMQSQIGGTEDEPLMLDESGMNFIQL
jgi:hypothetical protein